MRGRKEGEEEWKIENEGKIKEKRGDGKGKRRVRRIMGGRKMEKRNYKWRKCEGN